MSIREVLERYGALGGFLALVVGLALGTLFPGQLSWLGEGVSKAFGFLAAAAPYIIFFTLTPAIMGMLATGSAARFALWVTVAFMLTTLGGAVVAIILLTPIFQLPVTAGDGSIYAAFAAAAAQTANLAGTSPPFIAIWYGTLVALFLYFGARVRRLEWFCRPTGEVITAIGVQGVEYLGKGVRYAFPPLLFAIGVFIPVGVGEAIDAGRSTLDAAGGIAQLGGASPVTWYFVNVGVMAFILGIFVFGFAAVVCWYTGFSFRRFFRDYFAYVYPFSWATASSAASIPINLERTHEALGARKEVRDFIIPLGATVNLDGTMIGAFVVTVIASLLVGYQPTVVDLLILVIPLTVVSVGIPGIPGGMAAVAPPVVVSILPLGAEAALAFMAIFFAFGVGLSDQFRTGVNTVDNGILCLLFEHWYPTKFAREQVDLSDVAAAATSGTPVTREADSGDAAPSRGDD